MQEISPAPDKLSIPPLYALGVIGDKFLMESTRSLRF